MRIILVHGVGNPKLGSLLDPVAQQVGHKFQRADLILGDRDYPRVTADGHVTEILEVNWADLRRPISGAPGALRHLVWLISSMLTVPRRLCPEEKFTYKVLAGYEFVFQAIIFWVLPFPIISMFLYAAKPPVTIAVTAVGVLGIVTLAWIFGRYWRWYYAGFLWAAIFLGFAIFGITHSALESTTQIAARQYVGGQLLLGAVLLITGGFVISRKDLKWSQRLGNLSLLYLPFALLSGIGALIWSLSLVAVQKMPQLFDPRRFSKWGDLFTGALHYDLDYVELVFTELISAIGCFALILAFLYFIAGRKRRGFAQNGFAVLLYVMPILLGIGGWVFGDSFVSWQTHAVDGPRVLNIYLRSAVRLVPFLPFCIGPMRIALDVFGDVIFFLAPGRISIRAESEDRFIRALNYVQQSNATGEELVIFCHSQGSIIVRDVLGSHQIRSATLITVGSPLDTIYRRFLGWHPSSHMPPNVKWTNEFRTGDYIGGCIADAHANNVEIGPGGHTGYWSDPRAWNPVIDKVATSSRLDA
jgi:hypothetical protein